MPAAPAPAPLPVRAADPAEADKIRALPWSLGSNALNSIFCAWTFGGAVFLLFLDQLGFPKHRIGELLSLFPFCGVLALFLAPAAARLGRKRVFLGFYFVRKFIMAGLVLVPWVTLRWGPAPALGFVFAIILAFALCRAIAETAFYPWVQEYIPDRVRGTYSAASGIVTPIASAAATLVAAWWLRGADAGLGRFLWLIGLGAAIGVVSVLLMLPVPGGAPVPSAGGPLAHLADLRDALADRNFRAYLGALGLVTSSTTVLVLFLPLFLKERLGLPPATVVLMDTLMLAGGVLSSYLWGRGADRYGSRPMMMPSLSLGLAVPVLWLALPRAHDASAALAGALYFLNGVATAGITISTGRLLFNGVVPPARNTPYTALYYAWAGLTGGLAPLAAGWLLEGLAGRAWHVGPLALDGYALLFLAAFALFVPGLWLFRRVRPDSEILTRQLFQRAAAALRG